jgi:glycosyltransferase involved in cell wall biosynthesis
MIQYMAVGVPVLSSAVGANVDIFRDSNAGALVAPREDWGAVLTKLLEQRTRFSELGNAGRAHAVKHFSVEAVIEKYVQLFTRLTR